MISEGANIYIWWTLTSNLVTFLTQFLAVCGLISIAGWSQSQIVVNVSLQALG